MCVSFFGLSKTLFFDRPRRYSRSIALGDASVGRREDSLTASLRVFFPGQSSEKNVINVFRRFRSANSVRHFFGDLLQGGRAAALRYYSALGANPLPSNSQSSVKPASRAACSAASKAKVTFAALCASAETVMRPPIARSARRSVPSG